jgi:hypothetical protein
MIENMMQMMQDPVMGLREKIELPINTANGLQVTSNPELEVARDIVRAIKDLEEEVNKVFEPIVKKAYAAHKAAKKAQNEHLEPLERAEASLKLKMSVYLRKVELERLTAEKIKEAEIKEAEVARKEAIQEALQYAPEGAKVLPPKLRPLMPVPIPSPPPKVEGVIPTKVWKWKVTDASLIPADYWVLDEVTINATVRAQKGETQIPGIEVYSEGGVAVTKE